MEGLVKRIQKTGKCFGVLCTQCPLKEPCEKAFEQLGDKNPIELKKKVAHEYLQKENRKAMKELLGLSNEQDEAVSLMLLHIKEHGNCIFQNIEYFKKVKACDVCPIKCSQAVSILDQGREWRKKRAHEEIIKREFLKSNGGTENGCK